jgi:hypothetical protein
VPIAIELKYITSATFKFFKFIVNIPLILKLAIMYILIYLVMRNLIN